jgi:hypothetical protein
MMLLKTIYLNRYSNTEEPDDQGRWVRLAVCNNIRIARISKTKVLDQDVYSVY